MAKPIIISTRNAFVYSEDLDDEDLDTVKDVCGNTFENPPAAGYIYGEMARRIRLDLDRRMQTRGWNCVVGRAFGGCVTQRIKCYAYLTVCPGVNVLVWRG